MYVCMYLCMYVCIYIYIYTHSIRITRALKAGGVISATTVTLDRAGAAAQLLAQFSAAGYTIKDGHTLSGAERDTRNCIASWSFCVMRSLMMGTYISANT